MKKFALLLLSVFFPATAHLANGVGIIDAHSAVYLKMISSTVNVNVEDQIAIVKTTQEFRNETGEDQHFKYAFPMRDGASAIGLRWFVYGQWHQANIAAAPPDTTLPGSGDPHPDLLAYLGELPLYFNVDDSLAADSSILIELSYVEFLHYEFGNVYFTYPNDYHLIQTLPVDLQELNFDLTSSRTIESIQLLSHNPTTLINGGNSANIQCQIFEEPANENYEVWYSLSLEELGLFSFSTYQPDSLVPDELGQGFFVFVAEPDPSQNSTVINKVFTLIVDRSGSMSGNKIVQARNAAKFIVQNLNEGDMFNIVDFSGNVSNFSNEHVPFNDENEAAALAYISTFNASGSTNISGAFSVAIPQFAQANDSTANIIIFFTDGQATSGITNTNQILSHVQNLIAQNETDLLLFTFGIGGDVNQQLLTLLASQNNGISVFLGNDELEEVITQFYLQIRNPVLLNTQMTFEPDVLSEVYPEPLPNLYKGQQMIVAGRYNEAADVNLTLSGEAFGQPVEYNYLLQLSDSAVVSYQFLPKVWAKKKIEYLMVLYYSLDPNSPQAEELTQEIIELSIAYGVITPFTSFVGPPNPTPVEEEDEIVEIDDIVDDYKILGNYPNPFNPSTKIRFAVGKDIYKVVKIRIYNSLGQLVRELEVNVNGRGIYEVLWDGKLQNGLTASSDVYIYVVDFGNVLLANKMILMK